MKGLTWRIVVVFVSIVFAVYLLIPSIIRFQTGAQIPKVAKSDDPWYYHVLPSEVLKLGLDLKGGLHLVLGIDFEEVRQDAVVKLKNQIKEILERDKITGLTTEAVAGNKILVNYPSDDVWKKADAAIGKSLGTTLDVVSEQKAADGKGGVATFQMTPTYEEEVKKRAIDQSLETLRNRIDEFGIAEPILTRQGDDKIMLQFPGVTDPGRLKDIIARTAKLSFQIVRSSAQEEPNGPPPPSQLQTWVDDFKKDKKIVPTALKPIASYTKELNEFLGEKLPKGSEILFKKITNVNTKEVEYQPYLLDKEAMVTGEDLEDAYYTFDAQNGNPEVNFQLTPVGAQKFEKATGENVHKYMAIVLDNNVHSAPSIRERIGGGRAKIDMKGGGRTQQDMLNDAKDTALVLRSGALPARLEFLEERVVGPSLGGDAIHSGTMSLIAGLALVFIFMSVYYRGSGLVAVIALSLNGLLIFSILAAFEGTLTLPGLAGITLTLGMAVDANVLIFEHIREELRGGKSVNLAIAEGYSRAFTAIFDTHVTTIIAAIILLSFGYGPIRGFAVTLLVGLAASLYTSVFVTRVIQDYFIVSKGKKTISV
jgi:preprotein translocase subunit SecD